MEYMYAVKVTESRCKCIVAIYIYCNNWILSRDILVEYAYTRMQIKSYVCAPSYIRSDTVCTTYVQVYIYIYMPEHHCLYVLWFVRGVYSITTNLKINIDMQLYTSRSLYHLHVRWSSTELILVLAQDVYCLLFGWRGVGRHGAPGRSLRKHTRTHLEQL